jgi:hypothetical protein
MKKTDTVDLTLTEFSQVTGSLSICHLCNSMPYSDMKYVMLYSRVTKGLDLKIVEKLSLHLLPSLVLIGPTFENLCSIILDCRLVILKVSDIVSPE